MSRKPLAAQNLEASKTLTVSVKKLCGACIKFDVNKLASVQTVLESVHDLWAVPKSAQSLCYDGGTDEATVYTIHERSTLLLDIFRGPGQELDFNLIIDARPDDALQAARTLLELFAHNSQQHDGYTP